LTNEPVYMAVANTLMKEIAAGKHRVGSALPTERELCDVYQISRHTARESLRQLEQRGLIAKRQGSGSTVLAQQPSVRYEQSVQSIDDLLQLGNQSRLEVLDTHQMADEGNQFCREIALVARKPCIHVEAIRYARNDARPLAIVSIYVAVQSKRQAQYLLNSSTAAREIVSIVDINRIGRIEQALSAVLLDRQQAKLLQVKSGDAAMRTLRHYFNPAGNLLVIANSLYQGELYTYLSTLRRA
jgi:GntR family transcriptional regulator